MSEDTQRGNVHERIASIYYLYHLQDVLRTAVVAVISGTFFRSADFPHHLGRSLLIGGLILVAVVATIVSWRLGVHIAKAKKRREPVAKRIPYYLLASVSVGFATTGVAGVFLYLWSTEQPNFIRAPELSMDEKASYLERLGDEYYTHGQRDDAEKVDRELLATVRLLKDPHDERVAAAQSRLGLVERDMGQGHYEEAETALRDALTIRNMRPERPAEIARAINNLALLHRTEGLYDQALAEYKRAASMFDQATRASKNKQHVPEEAWNHIGLGIIHRYNREYDQAIAEFSKAMTMFQSDEAKPDEYAWALNNIARAEYERAGSETGVKKTDDCASADKHLSQVIRLWSNAFGFTASDVTVSLRNKVKLLHRWEHIPEAEATERDLKAREAEEREEYGTGPHRRYSLYDVPAGDNVWPD
jgi:tetratricopeptide (TPR) repeat protein